MIGFVLNGFVFVLVGLELPFILQGLGGRPPIEILGLATLISGVVVVTRIVWVFAASLLPGSPRRIIARRDARLAKRLTFVPAWPTHQPLLDRLESGLRDRTQHLATEDPEETAERRQERVEHEQIQRGVIAAQRSAVIELRDRGEINDETLRVVERELDLEELRMEG